MHNFNDRLLKASFTKALENKHVFAALANNSFTGQINQKNDIVRMLQLGNININAYVDGTDTTTQSLTDAQLELIADQDNYFDYALDTLEYNNVKGKIFSEAGRKAAYAQNDDVDTFLAGKYAQAGIVQNTNASPVDMTSLNVEDEFLAMAEAFADAGVPRSTRKAAIHLPWVTTKLTLAGIASKTMNDALYQEGFHTRALGWDFIESNNVSVGTASTGAKTRIMCVVPNESLGYASAVTAFETKSIEKQIGKTKVQGRFVYGGRVVLSDRTGVLYADKTAEA